MDTIFGIVIISIVVAAALTAWAVKLLNWLWFRPKDLEKFVRKQGLNGSPYSPFLEDVTDMFKIMKVEKTRSIKLSDNILPHIFPYHHHVLSNYGQNCFMWFGPLSVLSVCDPELIKAILKKPVVFQKPYREATKILTGGLLTKKIVPVIGLSCSSMIEKWEAMVSSRNEGWCEIDVWPYLEDLTGDVISRTAFGSSHEEGRRIFELQREKLKLTLQILQFSFIPGWRSKQRINSL